jgi:hypothetical protein
MGWLSNKDSKDAQDYTNGNKGGKPPKHESAAAKKAREAAVKAARAASKAAKKKANDMRVANPDDRCQGYRCKRKAAKHDILCSVCKKNPDQQNYVNMDDD